MTDPKVNPGLRCEIGAKQSQRSVQVGGAKCDIKSKPSGANLPKCDIPRRPSPESKCKHKGEFDGANVNRDGERVPQKCEQTIFLPTSEYLDATVAPILTKGLRKLLDQRSSDPIEFLAAYLYKNKKAFTQDNK